MGPKWARPIVPHIPMFAGYVLTNFQAAIIYSICVLFCETCIQYILTWYLYYLQSLRISMRVFSISSLNFVVSIKEIRFILFEL